MSIEKTYQGRLVSVVEVKGGWTTVLDGMKQLKVRNSELSDVTAKAAPAQPNKDRLAKPSRAKAVAKHDAGVKASKAAKPATASTLDDGRLLKADLSQYTVSDVRTASGRKAIDKGDDVATRLRGMDLLDVYREASAATGKTQKDLHAKYDHLNPGMQRMNLGNLIRGAAAAERREAEKAKAAKAK